MSDYDPIELDEATLREIEEEASREVRAELEANDDMWRELEAEALREAGLDDSEIDESIISDMKRDAATLLDDDLDVDTLDLGDVDVHAPAADGMSGRVQDAGLEPTPEQPAQDDAINQAKAKARKSAKKKAVAKARQAAADQVRKHCDNAPAPGKASLDLLEQDMKNKSGTMKKAVIAMVVIIVLGGLGVYGIIKMNDTSGKTPATNSPPPAAVAKTAEAKKKDRAARILFSKIRKLAGRKQPVAAQVEEGFAKVATLKEKYPDFVKNNADALAQAEEKLQAKQTRLEDMRKSFGP